MRPNALTQTDRISVVFDFLSFAFLHFSLGPFGFVTVEIYVGCLETNSITVS